MVRKINKKSRRFTNKRTLLRNKSRIGGEIKNTCARIFKPCSEFMFNHDSQRYIIKKTITLSKSKYSLYDQQNTEIITSTDIKTFIDKLIAYGVKQSNTLIIVSALKQLLIDFEYITTEKCRKANAAFVIEDNCKDVEKFHHFNELLILLMDNFINNYNSYKNEYDGKLYIIANSIKDIITKTNWCDSNTRRKKDSLSTYSCEKKTFQIKNNDFSYMCANAQIDEITDNAEINIIEILRIFNFEISKFVSFVENKIPEYNQELKKLGKIFDNASQRNTIETNRGLVNDIITNTAKDIIGNAADIAWATSIYSVITPTNTDKMRSMIATNADVNTDKMITEVTQLVNTSFHYPKELQDKIWCHHGTNLNYTDCITNIVNLFDKVRKIIDTSVDMILDVAFDKNAATALAATSTKTDDTFQNIVGTNAKSSSRTTSKTKYKTNIQQDEDTIPNIIIADAKSSAETTRQTIKKNYDTYIGQYPLLQDEDTMPEIVSLNTSENVRYIYAELILNNIEKKQPLESISLFNAIIEYIAQREIDKHITDQTTFIRGKTVLDSILMLLPIIAEKETISLKLLVLDSIRRYKISDTLRIISFIESELQKLNSIKVDVADRQQHTITALKATNENKNIEEFKSMIMNMIKFILNTIILDMNVYIPPILNTVYNKFVEYIDEEKITIDEPIKENFKNILLNNICYLRYISPRITEITKNNKYDDETKKIASIISTVIQTKLNLSPGKPLFKLAMPIIFDYDEEELNSHFTDLTAKFKESK